MSITPRIFLVILAIAVSPIAVTPSAACGDDASLGLVQLAGEATSPDEYVAFEAIAELRERGREGLDVLGALHDAVLEQEVVDAAYLARIRTAMDIVAGQKDAHASRLFWHTDLAAAKAEAQASGRPILSLRLLGNLDEDLSCANSRFFRTALYPNAEVGRMLREGFVLHWESVRPVPVITIDMGDGRKICRTVTGNSAHYVLTPEGRPVDALPGLYGPKAFLRGLAQGRAIALDVAKAAPAHRDGLLASHHAALRRNVDAAWSADLVSIGRRPVPVAVAAASDGHPDAAVAAPVAGGKFAVERPLVRAVMPAAALRDATDESAWSEIAKLHRDDARLDASSVALMRKKVGIDARLASRVAVSKRRVEDPMLRMVRRFEDSMAVDTVRNEYDLHRRIHEWFAAGEVGTDLGTLNERVYAELFLTPSSDPWLGLVPDATYVALDASGLR